MRFTPTSTVGLDAPRGVTAIVPPYVPGARADGFTVTVSVAGVVPAPGPTASQAPPAAVVALAEKLNGAPLDATNSGCEVSCNPAPM